ncbi:hypothetical protein O181_027575 [Austropuccinia psidii MF-1]|uniref:Reverse transcriptase Ty1/copia-type domain-containing protein n=1 Tax=Austropuccinia psidii MF-1 TaxID=1389203 RepID=A0A9Q3CRA9_9BASI|nr:hypothetical protein [Austropuccinia psidii MF-1]
MEENSPQDKSQVVVDEVHNSGACDNSMTIRPHHPTLISSNVTCYNTLPYNQRAEKHITTISETPQTSQKALKSPSKEAWIDAMSKELENMKHMKLWDMIVLDPGYKLVGTTWVFKRNKDHSNNIIAQMARLCVQGFTQMPGIDFNKTFPPAGRFNSLCTLIAFAEENSLDFHQVYFKSAFLNAPLTETVYLSITQGMNQYQGKKCLCLNEEIYGLKQAPLAWYKRLRDWLVTVGLKSCTLNLCVFFSSGKRATWLYVHIDDIATFSSNVEAFKLEIKQEFEIKDLGRSDLMLGVKISQESQNLTLD